MPANASKTAQESSTGHRPWSQTCWSLEEENKNTCWKNEGDLHKAKEVVCARIGAGCGGTSNSLSEMYGHFDLQDCCEREMGGAGGGLQG